MKLKKFGGTEQIVYDLVAPIVTEMGYAIWDVCFEKEGAFWYLRIFVDFPPEEAAAHPDGITIADCERLTKPVNDAVDRADPISQAYVLEVGSAGLERELNQLWHFAASVGMEVRARAIRPIDGVREWIGILRECDGTQVTIELADETICKLALAELSYIKRYVALEF